MSVANPCLPKFGIFSLHRDQRNHSLKRIVLGRRVSNSPCPRYEKDSFDKLSEVIGSRAGQQTSQSLPQFLDFHSRNLSNSDDP